MSVKSSARIAGILALAVAAAPASAAPFDPMRFFEGRTESEGIVKVVLHAAHAVHVHGRGHVEPDGTLVLTQTVEEEGEPIKQRSWRRPRPATSPGRSPTPSARWSARRWTGASTSASR